MTQDIPKDEMHKILFANLIMMLHSSAMQQLGKIVNPMTNKTEVDLKGAEMTIDMISMLQAKTADHCDENETKMISDILASLQLNFVETAKGDEKEETAKPDESTDSDPEKESDAEKKPDSEEKAS